MSAPQIVSDLVERFRKFNHSYSAPQYNETQLRIEFINPLFEALGWDVSNKSGYSDTYKDVVHEYSLKIGGSIKAPDYSFRIGGARKFFVEAKKPAVNILKDPEPAFQLKRYAWSAKLPVSILTNFRDLAIYDCTKQPEQLQSPAIARMLLKRYDEFESDWTEIEQLIGKEGVLKGGLDAYVSTPSVKRGSLQVDDAFLRSMETWREQLAINLAHRNRQLTVEGLNFAVQTTLDRIVFLRIAEDRGIETYGQLSEAAGKTGVYASLLGVFRRADERYNSGLFHFREEKGIEAPADTLTPDLVLDDRVLRSIVNDLYYPNSPYEFSVLSADILGQVYEQFLGKVIRLTSKHEAKVEEKPEVKKSGGIYYTPMHIVRHIVENTVGEASKTASPASLRRLKVLDPACGSGSFLIEVYQYLLDWYLKKYIAAGTQGAQRRLYQAPSGELRLSLDERRRVLLDHIYGVDIDRQAVEVTKLSLLMKLLEGETDESINTQLELLPVRVLPDLNKNIKWGNSLIDPDIEEKMRITEEEYNSSRPFEWAVEFPDAMSNGGFDVVLGNPPYDVVEKDRNKASWPHSIIREYVNRGGMLEPAMGHKLNMYRFFIVKSLELTRQTGHWGLIVPMSIMADVSTTKTRRYMLENTAKLVADCFPQKDNPSDRVFKNAKLSTVVVTGSHAKSADPSRRSMHLRVHPGKSFDETLFENSVRLGDLKHLDPDSWPIPMTSARHWKLCRKIHLLEDVELAGAFSSLKITRGEINQTIYKDYISTDESHYRMLKGSELEPFHVRDEPSQGVREWIDADRFHLDYPRRDFPPARRIALQRITGVDERRRLCATIVDEAIYFADSTNSIVVSDKARSDFDLYMCGLLNSDLFQWRFKITSSNNNVGTNEIQALPIVSSAAARKESFYQQIVTNVRELLKPAPALNAAEDASLRARRVARRWRRLNDAVFDLYELDPEERDVVVSALDYRAKELTPIEANSDLE